MVASYVSQILLRLRSSPVRGGWLSVTCCLSLKLSGVLTTYCSRVVKGGIRPLVETASNASHPSVLKQQACSFISKICFIMTLPQYVATT